MPRIKRRRNPQAKTVLWTVFKESVADINDNSYDEDDCRHYSALIISNSDSDMQPQKDRRVAPNKLHVISLDMSENKCIFLTPRTSTLESYFTIIPYSEAQDFIDTDPTATKDRQHDVDFSLNDFIICGSGFPYLEPDEAVLAGTSPLFSFEVQNISMCSFSGDTTARIIVKNEDEEVVLDERRELSLKLSPLESKTIYPVRLNGSLPEGSYTAELILNDENRINEAFRFNNTFNASAAVSCRDDGAGWCAARRGRALSRAKLLQGG